MHNEGMSRSTRIDETQHQHIYTYMEDKIKAVLQLLLTTQMQTKETINIIELNA